MLRHPAVLAIIVNNFAFHYAFYVAMNWLPTYFGELLKARLSDLGGVTALPYVAMFLMSNVGGWAGDWLINSKMWTVAAGRKAINTAGGCCEPGSWMVRLSSAFETFKDYVGEVGVKTVRLG